MEEEIRRMQRFHDQLQPGRAVQDALVELKRREVLIHETYASTILARDVLKSISTTQAALETAASLMSSKALFQAAIQPIPELRSFGFDVRTVMPTMLDRPENASIDAAAFLAATCTSGIPTVRVMPIERSTLLGKLRQGL